MSGRKREREVCVCVSFSVLILHHRRREKKLERVHFCGKDFLVARGRPRREDGSTRIFHALTTKGETN